MPLKKNYDLMVDIHLKKDLSESIANSLKKIIKEAFALGLKIDNLNDFVKFLMSEL